MTQSGPSRTVILIGLGLATICGCGMDLDPSMVGSLQQVVVTADKRVNSANFQEPITPQLSKTWTAPYPQRVNPFRYPSDDVEPVNSTRRETNTSHVSVIGFANVDRPIVLLRFRDQSHTLGVGEEHGGIRVAEIAPPKVTLQMSNLVWTISMFDKPTH